MCHCIALVTPTVGKRVAPVVRLTLAGGAIGVVRVKLTRAEPAAMRRAVRPAKLKLALSATVADGGVNLSTKRYAAIVQR